MKYLTLILITLMLTACVTIPSTGIYENPVLRNHRQQYLAQNPQLPPDVRQAIASQHVMAGMSRMDVMASWGPPASCSRILGGPGSKMVCLYTDTTRSSVLGQSYRDTDYKSVYFEAGRVVDWQLH